MKRLGRMKLRGTVARYLPVAFGPLAMCGLSGCVAAVIPLLAGTAMVATGEEARTPAAPAPLEVGRAAPSGEPYRPPVAHVHATAVRAKSPMVPVPLNAPLDTLIGDGPWLLVRNILPSNPSTGTPTP
jgi:hypothetical protein